MNTTSGLGGSIFLVAIGAVLAWAVTAEVDGVDLQMVGYILFAVGLVGALLSLVAGASGRTRTVVERDRDVVVERDPRG